MPKVTDRSYWLAKVGKDLSLTPVDVRFFNCWPDNHWHIYKPTEKKYFKKSETNLEKTQINIFFNSRHTSLPFIIQICLISFRSVSFFSSNSSFSILAGVLQVCIFFFKSVFRAFSWLYPYFKSCLSEQWAYKASLQTPSQKTYPGFIFRSL